MSRADKGKSFVPSAAWIDGVARQAVTRGTSYEYNPPHVPLEPDPAMTEKGSSPYGAYMTPAGQDRDFPGINLPSSNPPRKGQAKIATVMGEFKRGTLKSGSGGKVTSPKQAKAIALSEARRAGARIPKPKGR